MRRGASTASSPRGGEAGLELRRVGWASVDRSLWPGFMTSLVDLTEELSR